MAWLLRVMKQSRWIMLDWMPAGAIQSDALLDLRTADNMLSTFRFRNNDEFESIVVGLASNRNKIENLDYVILDESEIHSAGIIPVQINGNTPCDGANLLHCDLQELTVEKVVKLAEIISEKRITRIPRKTIENKIRNAIASGLLDSSKIQKSLHEELILPASMP